MTTITNDELDRLARQIVKTVKDGCRQLAQKEELVWVLHRAGTCRCREPYHFRMVPNRSVTPAETFIVHTEDVVKRIPIEDVVGVFHTHTPDDDNEDPSDDDLDQLPPGMVGGVYMPGADKVYWHAENEIRHITTLVHEPAKTLFQGA